MSNEVSLVKPKDGFIVVGYVITKHLCVPHFDTVLKMTNQFIFSYIIHHSDQ